MKARALSLALGAALVASCGGGATGGKAPAGPPPPATEAPAGAYPQQEQGEPGYAPAPSDESHDFAEPPAAEEAGPSDKDSATRSIEEASLELDRAASELSAAGTDCARVCKALGSMNRAAERICVLESDGATSSRCRRARERVAEAADRVRRSCTCP